jgi:hypothetical protein
MVVAASIVTALGMFSAVQAQDLFFEGDMVRGHTPNGSTGPGCVLTSQYMRQESVVWRVRVLNAAGENLDGDGIKSLVIVLANGEEFPAKFGKHPRGEHTDAFWATSWIVPEDFPTGTMTYKVVATTLDDKTIEWQPFIVAGSQLTVIPGEVTFTK